jgi:hypothetical protein
MWTWLLRLARWSHPTIKWTWLLRLACTTATLVQLGFVLWNGYIRPSVTNTRVEEMELKDVDMPVVLKICVTPGFNMTAIKEMGYDDPFGVYRYFNGESKYNQTILGWAGHTNTSRVHGSVAEVLKRVRAHTADEVINKVGWFGRDNTFHSINISDVHLGRVNFPDNCYTLDIGSNARVKKHGVKYLYIDFKALENRSAEVHVQGSSLACDRTIKAHRLYSEGDKITMQKMNLFRMFVVNLKKNVFVKEDPTKNCRDYPNPEYASYRECDHRWMKDSVARIAPGLLPIWLADNTDNVSIHHFSPELSSILSISDMMDGLSLSDCPLPCSTIYAQTRFISETTSDSSQIEITFSPSTQVTTTDFLKPPLSSFLSSVGGSVGLWLGLGALQAAEILANCAMPWIRRCRCRCRG